MSDKPRDSTLPDHGVSHGEALRVWIKVALLSFGGPAGQIAVMHRLLVEEKRWISESRFLHALNYCMLLPGPEAQQLATYMGWLLHRTRGGLTAGILFILPGFLSILALSMLYAGYQGAAPVEALFFGLKPAVMAIVMHAVIRIGGKALKNTAMYLIAVAAFVGIFFFNIPFPAIVIGAALVGWIGGHFRPGHFLVIKPHGVEDGRSGPRLSDQSISSARPTLMRGIRVALIWLVLWALPFLLIALIWGRSNVFMDEGLFFSKAAVVTFGGAYAVLAYIAQQAVGTYGWLQPGEMLDGLGMAESTPGPLIMVVQFVGFMGAYRNPMGLDPMLAGVIGSVVVTWVTFVPCFLWIFLGAPYIEYLRGNRALTAALSGITAAVVGVILNLALWFSLHTLFGEVLERSWYGVTLHVPVWTTLDLASAVLTAGAFLALFRFRLGLLPTIGLCVATGMAYRLIF